MKKTVETTFRRLGFASVPEKMMGFIDSNRRFRRKNYALVSEKNIDDVLENLGDDDFYYVIVRVGLTLVRIDSKKEGVVYKDVDTIPSLHAKLVFIKN